MSELAFLKTLVIAKRRDRRFSFEQFQRAQQRRLRRLVDHARSRVPFHAQRLAKIDPRTCRLQDLPTVGKQTMMEHFDESVTDRLVSRHDVEQFTANHTSGVPWLDGKYLISRTSGTSGDAAWFLNDARTWAIQRGAVMARTMRDRLTPRRIVPFLCGNRYRMAFLNADCPYSVSWQAARTVGRARQLIADIRMYSVLDSIDSCIAGLNEFQPHYIHSYPSYLEPVARRTLEGSGLTFEPLVVSMGSEALAPSARSAIRSAFPDAWMGNQYGTTECIPMGNQCRLGNMHVNSDYCIIEPVDADDQPVSPGEQSNHILVTNLVNTFQPVIRYRVDDSIRMWSERCECGSPLPVIEIQGRLDDIFWLRDNQDTWIMAPPIGVLVTMITIKGIDQYRIVHRRQNEIVAYVVPRGAADVAQIQNDIQERFRDWLTGLGCERSVQIVVEPVEMLERPTDSGKLRQVESLVDPPQVGASTNVSAPASQTQVA